MDLERFRLRRFLESLPPAELQRVDEPIALGDVAAVHDGNPKAVWFKQAGGAELAAGVTASRSRLALAFDTKPDRLLAEVLRRLDSPQPVVDVSAAPAQEVVETEPDLTALPVHLQHGYDGAPYISASMDFTRDPAREATNIGIRRLMLRGRREAGVDLNAPSDLQAIYRAAVARKERLPISFVVGSHPVDHVAAAMRLPGDELALMASLRGAPLPVVKCKTNDLRVPADAEYVLEGYLDERGYVEPEGPYGEFLGYYGALKTNPVFHLTAITRRKDAVFQAATISGRRLDRTDTAQLNAIRVEVSVWRALAAAVGEVVAVYATPSSGGAFNLRASVRQRMPGEARNAIGAVFATPVNVKHVFIVDPDVDVFSDEQIDWALATRFQADRDLVVASGFRAMPLDPSLRGAKTGSKAGFDLTLPFGDRSGIEGRPPEPPRYEGRRFDSLEAALADGPKFFAELMSAQGSRDGREIVRELERLRGNGRLERDAEGRYVYRPTAAAR